ncbi:MAG TPA: hypothetical protein VH814_02350 [Steroidobacteraceae bacterium]|jgi:hypothetical protein
MPLGRRSGFSPILLCCSTLAVTLPLHAQDSILGQHKIDLRLKPLPVADVLNILSVRSKSVGRVTEQTAEWGRPWTVEGVDQLAGIVVTVDFVATPVHEVVDETLGCIGYAYAERADRIVIENIKLRVDVTDMRADDVLKNVLGCIGWEYQKSSVGVSAYESSSAHSRAACEGFRVL